MKTQRVALLLLGVSSRNCGGAERFFADLFHEYAVSRDTKHEMLFLLDPSTHKTLHEIGKLKSDENIVVLANFNNRFKRVLENINLLFCILRYRIKLIHVTNYGRNYYDRLRFVMSLPSFLRPVVAVNIVDCEIPYILGDPKASRHKSYEERYLPLFRSIRPHAYFSWYKLFLEFVQRQGYVAPDVLMEATETRFANTLGYTPSPVKDKVIVFAARLTEQKRPMMFVHAVKILAANNPELISDWKFCIYGDGPEAETVQHEIRKSGLEKIIQINPTADLRPVYSRSTCFVSTQEFENFPSLSMNEAMAAGNVLVACNVGQTSLFLEEGKNGFLAPTEDAQGVANAMRKVLESRNLEKMAAHSVYLAREVHTPANFISKIDRFWNKLLR
jgi:glycosyltransferase involved in cell wall biosynthesis